MNTRNAPEQFREDLAEALLEAHARPSIAVPSPGRVMQIAFRGSDADITSLFEAAATNMTHSGPRHVISRSGGLRLKLERHTEFSTLMMVSDAGEPNPDMPFPMPDLFDASRFDILVKTDILLFGSLSTMVKHLPKTERVIGGALVDNLDIRTTLKPDANGCITFYAQSKAKSADENGRRIQRLVEMETYRIMALIGLPVARRASESLRGLEQDLTSITTRMAADDSQSAEASELLFDELTALSARASAIMATTRFRFSASHAYAELVRDRMAMLSETKMADVQRLTSFVSARLDPAIATIESTGRRQVVLAEDISRALSMLRTKVELNLNRQNQKLLQSMDLRHQQHVKIAQAVEGLSAVAITYYTVGLLGYVFKGLDKLTGIEGLSTLGIAISAPIVFVSVWMLLRSVRNKLEL